MGTESFLIVMLGIVAFLLVVAVVLMALVATHLKAMKREAEAVRAQLAKMDWTQLLFNGVQQLKDIVKSLETIDKRLQKLEAIEKVQLSHINFRAGV
jgi:biopolymer transport protein ExbB/TolQ